MTRRLRTALLFCLTALLLTGTAFADFGPKPQLVVKMVNGPEEPYYLDLLAEGTFENRGHGGLEWRYDRDVPLDEDLFAALLEAVPDGWHACTAQGTDGAPMWGDFTGENGVHTFGYWGVPETYRILVVTASGETWVSGTMKRIVLQSSATVDWASKTVTTPPVWVGYVLQFLSTFLPTLLVEGVILLAFGFDWKKNWKPFLLVNLVTQGALAVAVSYFAVGSGFNYMWYVLLIVPAEVAIALVEALLYRKLLKDRTKARAFAYGLTANAASALLGWFLVEPVWRWIVTIS